MLSLGKVTAEKAINYYSKDNYYTKDQCIEHSEWFGFGCEALGLSGKINPEAFENLLYNRLPDGGSPLVDKRSMAKGDKQRAGIDLTFSASKSVTLTSLYDERIIQAHKDSVVESLKIIEKDAALYRQGKERTVHKSGNLIVAQFHHDTSRKVSDGAEPDPQLHTHCVTINAVKVKGEEGEKWQAIYDDLIYKNSKLYGMIYQSILLKKCEKLGYETEISQNGTFEIKGYEREQLEFFSKRMTQIKSLNAKSKKEERSKMLGLRHKKDTLDHDSDLRKVWKDQIKELNISIPKPRFYKGIFKEIISSEKIMTSAIKHFSERDVSFSESQLLNYAYSSKLGRVKSFEELKKAMVNSPLLLNYGYSKNGEALFTTFEALKSEKEILGYVKDGRGKFKAIAKESQIEKSINKKEKAGTKLNEGQEKAFRLLNTSTDQFVVWQGVAGAGKSFVLSDVKTICKSQDYSITVLATDGAGAEALAKDVGIKDAQTVAFFLIKGRKKGEEIPKKQLWVVDESGKMTTKDMQSLMERAKKEGARVAFIGDTRQLSAVGSGNPFKLIIDRGVQIAYLNEHQRQKNSDVKRAVELMSEGKVRDSLNVLRPNIYEYARQSTRVNKVVLAYLALDDKAREKTLVLAGTHDERKKITAGIREALKAEGKLGKSIEVRTLRSKDMTVEAAKVATFYDVGDVIVVRDSGLKSKNAVNIGEYEVVGKKGKNLILLNSEDKKIEINPSKITHKSVYSQERQEICEGDKLRWTKTNNFLGIKNGKDIVVEKINKNQITVREISSDKKYVMSSSQFHYFDHNIVATTYSSQGKTADHVIIAGDNTIGKELIYVGLSRTKYSVSVFTDSFEKLVKLSERSKAKKTAHDLLENRTLYRNNKSLSESKTDIIDKKSDFIKGLQEGIKSGRSRDTLEQMDGFITEAKGNRGKFSLLARDYVAMPLEKRLDTAILTTTNADKKSMDGHLRRELIRSGEIKNVKKVEFLIPKKIDQDSKIVAGDILIFKKGSSAQKLRKDVQYHVSSIQDGIIIFNSPSGKKLGIHENEFNGNVYNKVKSSLGEGDLVLNGNKKAVISKITEKKVEVTFDNGASKTMDLSKPLLLKHNYSETVFAKGETKENVMLVADKSLGDKALGRALARSNTQTEVYVNDKEALKSRFGWYQEKNIEKQERMEHLQDISKDFKNQKFVEAFKKLEPQVFQNEKSASFYIQAARKFSSLSPEERTKVSLLASDEVTAKSLKSYVRKELFNKGELKNLTEAHFLQAKSDIKSIKKGDYYIASETDFTLNVRTRYQVADIDKEKILFKTNEGETFIAFKSDISGNFYGVYKNSIAEGDTVLNINKQNGHIGVVKEISDGNVHVDYKDGSSERIKLDKPLALEHSIVSISTNKEITRKDQVIFVAGEKSSSFAISKAVQSANQSIEVYTPSKEKLLKRLSWFERENKQKSLKDEIENAFKKIEVKNVKKSKGKGLGLDI